LISFPLRESFVQSLAKNYQAIARDLNFGNQSHALKVINGDVEKATKGMIREIRNSIDRKTTALLVNAIYFHGIWQKSFEETKTNSKAEFHLSNGEKVEIPMMSQEKRFRIGKYHESDIIRLPYNTESTEDSVYMVIILPKSGQSVAEVLADFDAGLFSDSLDSCEELEVDVNLPRFKLESSHSLVSTLKSLGIKEAFSKQANLLRMSQFRFMVSNVFQKAVIEVNEKGTKAAAATAIFADIRSLTKEFCANRPFIYVLINEKIKSKVKNILFIGVVENPLKN